MNGQFEKGNSVAANKGEFKQAIKRALAAENGQRLRDAAEKLLDLAASGERWACEMLRDTLDGKPAQQIVATDSEGRGLTIVLADLSNIERTRELIGSSTQIQPPALSAESPGSAQSWN